MGQVIEKLFSSNSQNRVTKHDKAVLDLKVQRDKLKQYQKKIEKVLDRETEIARELLRNEKKEKARLALKKKKYQQQLLERTIKQLDNIQEMTDSVEFAQMEKEVFNGLQGGTEALKEIQKEVSLEDVERLMDDSREAMEYQDEISRMLGENLTNEDEEDVMQQLDQMEKEMLDQQMPSIPSSTPVSKKETEEESTAKKEEEKEKEVWIPRLHETKKGQKFEVVSSAYEMLHNMNSEWPCLSFDVVGDQLGDNRSTYPLTGYITAGTQASEPEENCIYLIKVSQLNKTRYDSDSEGEDDDDNTGFDDNPEVDVQKVKQNAPINRIRSMPQHPHVIASWSADSNVYVHQLEHQLQALDRPQISSAGKSVAPLFTMTEHSDEGFAMDWSPLPSHEGSLITGSCDGSIGWIASNDGAMRCMNPSRPFRHEGSVEDLQWSPSEGNVFASCSVDQTIGIWDTRTSSPARSWHAHDADVNVISWNRSVGFLLASGGDDGKIKIWDLRKLKKGNETQPIGVYDFHNQPITSIEWNPNDPSELVASSEDDTITVWDMSVERDPEASTDKYSDMTSHLPDQLLFIHQGVENAKEVHYHPQLPGVIAATAESGFSFFKPDIYARDQ
eukprot:gb/GECH01012816.1/.p1 GENE.gb/GECH01012816.1/~~gb/GECH01012816.1/.p1  ORF type:complete len:616 (+),score=193.80 gb/GECH01012816.1/:1-1848(+)